MTLHIELDPGLEASLSVAAQSEGLSIEDFVRGCLKKQFGKAAPATNEETTTPTHSEAYELGKHVFGKYSSGRSDLSVNHEKILGEIFDEKHRNR
ncbi:hypothetical protein [Botrimarina mediterranea]|uniref:Ribbon-helix-helix protein CopG domain-containing protein n=1 Tax=Botrimarina mediterranea TaxID=2528022 RepID=A0A518KAU8_9BACT|nr:hypothetical protein [Botrimarina mediterranea]QDV74906.1 hypothetical protein Spa11_31150 [Botrimarina mediterranea]QDV79549.1 hypothetical protein K2D_31640 [Planctomycetes bacterium K2D]